MSESKINDGGSAFPIPNDDRPGAYAAEPGMSLRDWFAGQALAVLLGHTGSYGIGNGPGGLSTRAYEVADAMLRARDEALKEGAAHG